MKGFRMLHSTTSHIWLLGIALLSMSACTEAQSPEPSNPNFPRQRHEDTDRMQALMIGELVSENGCLRVRSEDGADHLLIWPNAAEMTADGQGARVRTSDGSEAILSVGEDVRIGGGELPLVYVQRRVLEPIPSECIGGWYWVVGEISTSSE